MAQTNRSKKNWAFFVNLLSFLQSDILTPVASLNYAALSTEKAHPQSGRLDRLSPAQIVGLMNRQDRQVLRAIATARPAITRAIRLIAGALRQGGRLYFVGAGT